MQMNKVALVNMVALAAGLTVAWWAVAQTGAVKGSASAAAAGPDGGVVTVPGMPPVADRNNLYREVGANNFSPAVANALERVYVPNHTANTVL